MQHQVDITRQACTRGAPEACGQGEICIFNEIKHVKLLGLDLLSIYYQEDFFILCIGCGSDIVFCLIVYIILDFIHYINDHPI